MKINKKASWVKVMYFAYHIDYVEGYRNKVCYNDRPNHVVKEYDLPRWIYENRRRFFDLKEAQLQLRLKQYHINRKYCFYAKAGEKEINESRSRSIASMRGQVTKWERLIKEYEEEQKQKLFWEPENDTQYQKALEKLKAKKQQYKAILKQGTKNNYANKL